MIILSNYKYITYNWKCKEHFIGTLYSTTEFVPGYLAAVNRGLYTCRKNMHNQSRREQGEIAEFILGVLE
jgi:hypothetical protein